MGQPIITKVTLKTPKDWVGLLRDIDFSFFEDKSGEPELEGNFRNPVLENGLRFNYDKFYDYEKGNFSVIFHVERFTREPKFLKGTHCEVFPYELVSPLELPRPEFIRVYAEGIPCIRKVLDDLLPKVVSNGYEFDGRGVIVKRNKYAQDPLVKLTRRETIIRPNTISNTEKWTKPDNLDMLVERYDGRVISVE